METLRGSVLTESGWIAGELGFAHRVDRIEGQPTETPEPPFVLPGFVDLHVHGGGGADMMAGVEAIRTAAQLHARHGTTAMLATSVTAPFAEIESFLGAVGSAMAADWPGAARVLGAHLEGPFLNPDKLGAQPDFAVAADVDALRRWLTLAPVRVMTLAPEMDPDDQVIAAAQAAGVRVQLGHSLCDYARAAACLQAGCGVTHLFNAMSPAAHRGNGLAGAALAHADYAEIIPDLLHVEPGAILAARRAIPGLYGVTDATAGAGMPDGMFRLGAQHVHKAEGAMRLADGTLAGSALTMDQALRNLVGIGLPLAEAAARLATLPADWIGHTDIGRIRVGAAADLLVLDGALDLTRVYICGQPLPV
ncbi:MULTISPECIES: N-acetylglucosamine-6-phosphate deacetylase [Mameliella]|uniref:N-acetylglucosamine-6-phosphate deacetylase n=1 Tax=Mameliella TaxID=1434019 RepID=UPI000B531E88|nr:MULTISPECIES: amidohydrolase family protein [Mameliella]MCR9273700.1 amidohydrolase family protein [Paracoccaceae bacterium]OWV56771.1 N-acetylglucosamine-6-phosphate deacetylase [Mameliella alba]